MSFIWAVVTLLLGPAFLFVAFFLVFPELFVVLTASVTAVALAVLPRVFGAPKDGPKKISNLKKTAIKE